MRARTATRLGWSLGAAYVLATVAFVLLARLNRHIQEPLAASLPILLAFAAFATIGALLVSRFHRHPIGWIFVTIGLGTALASLAQQYAIYALFTEPGSLPAGVAMAWLGGWLWIGSAATLVFVLLLFPDGKPLSPRWKPMVWVAGAGLAALLAPFLFKHGQLDMDQQYPVANPFGVHGWDAFFETIQAAGLVVYFLTVVGATIGLVVRANRSTGVERQQVKWLGYAGVFLVFMVLAGSVIGPAGALLGDEFVHNLSLFLFGLAVAGIPTATGVAIFRHHLYDIDVIINRTLVYGALTSVLALVYVGGVAGVGGLVRGLTGQERNDVVVAASTLTVAGLFRPARSRIQALIDRRFYRRKYDAARTLDVFSARLREEIDLESLSKEFLSVVQDAMQPAQVSLWLREREGRTRQPV